MSKTLGILLILSSTSVVTFTAGQASADPPQKCKAEEEWKVKNDKEGCYCIDRYSINDLSEMVPDLECEAFEMLATFHKCQFKDLNIYFDEDDVEENICYDFKNDSATNTFTISAPIHAGSCAFKSQETNDSQVTYTSNVLIDVKEPGAIIIRKKLNVTLKCSYDLDMITSLHKILNPIISPIVQEVPGKGTFKIYMSIFKKSNYTDAYSGSEVTLNTDEFLYVGVFVHGGDESTLLLVLKNCYATPENDVNSSPRYEIIEDSCPNKQDGTIKVDENGKSREGKFAVQMFKFVGKYDEVYLHCKVSLCDSSTGSCTPNCSARGSRIDGTAKSYDAPKTMTIGPIKQSGEPDSSTVTSSHIFWTLLFPALILLIQSL